MKLVTVLVPQTAPTTEPAASDKKACRARGNWLSFISPVWSATATSVPSVSKTTMNRKIRMKGTIGQERARRRSSLKKVGSMDGGSETSPSAIWNPCSSMSDDLVTSSDWAIPSGAYGRAVFNATERIVAATIPQKIAPGTRRAQRLAVSSSPKKKTIRSGEASW